MEKITKKNSILYNQLWINKAIEEGHMDFLPVNILPNKSIGEYIEIKYNQLEKHQKLLKNSADTNEFIYIDKLYNETPKVTKKNSLLFTIEWISKYKEEGLEIPKYIPSKYSLGEILELRYFERELINLKPHTEDILLLPNEKVKKLERKL